MLVRTFAAAGALCSLASGLRELRTQGLQGGGWQSQESTGVFRQVLHNGGDVQYTCDLKLGGQVLSAIPDTGSFELVVFSDKCGNCGTRDKLFHRKKDGTLTEGHLQSEQNYGSGTTYSQEAYDNVHVGKMVVEQQMFWEVVDADMSILESSTFQAIFGLGPPSSNQKMAIEERDMIMNEVSDMKKIGVDVTKYDDIVQRYKDVARFSKNETLWLTGLGMRRFSVCLGQASGSDGVFVYNDDTPQTLFPKKIKASQDLYWSAPLSDVQVDSHAGGTVNLGCFHGKCNAVLDTGTSLIVAPDDVVDKVLELVKTVVGIEGPCGDLSALSDLSFKLDGKEFNLPPESYVGEITGSVPDWAFKSMPYLARFRDLRRTKLGGLGNPDSELWCVPLLMSNGGGADWILGLPFFRKYYTMFELSEDSMNAHRMHFAEADENCRIGSANGGDFERKSIVRSRGVPLRINATMLMPPRTSAQPKRSYLKKRS